MIARGQSEFFPVIIYVGLALILGVAMLSYFSSVVSGYRGQLELSNHLQHEASSTHLNIVSYDIASSTLWILLRRLDGSRTRYFMAVDIGTGYLECTKIYMYNPYNDIDGILCNNANDCTTSTTIYRGSPDKVYIPWEGALSDFLTYAKTMGYSTGVVHICGIENVCRYSPNQGLCDDNTIARIQLPSGAKIVRIFIATIYNNIPYVVGVYEVTLG